MNIGDPSRHGPYSSDALIEVSSIEMVVLERLRVLK